MKNGKMGILIVGQAPNRTSDPARPLENGSTARRFSAAGQSAALGFQNSAKVNLVRRWPGKKGKGDRFPMPEARKTASRLIWARKNARFVLLGGAVARAFGIEPKPILKWRGESFEFCIIPHPSGINRWWNAPANVSAFEKFAREEVFPS